MITCVARSDAERHERKEQRIRAGGDPDAVRAPAVAGKAQLELAHLGAEDELLAAAHPGDGRLNLSRDLLVLQLEIQQRNLAWRAEAAAWSRAYLRQ